MEVQGRTVINNMQIETSTGTVYWQEAEPATPKDGDTWFKVVNGKATNAYNRENGAWVEVEFASQVIAEELVGKIITGAEINGATVNGTTINGGEVNGGRFLNKYTFPETNGRIEGFIDIEDGVLSARNEYIDEPSEVTRQNVGITIQNGGLFANNTVYDPDGTQTSYTGASMEGGTLSLSRIDATGSYNGMLDAKALTNTPWVNLGMNSDWETAEGNPPQYRTIYNLDGSRTIKFRGQVKKKSGLINPRVEHLPFRLNGIDQLPPSVRPTKTAFAFAPVGLQSNPSVYGLQGQWAVTPAGYFKVEVAQPTLYVALSLLTYDI